MSKLSIINMGSHTTPSINAESRTEWVPFGEKNDYFQYLIDRYNGSPTNNAVVTAIGNMIYGKGLAALNADKNPEGYADMMKLFKAKDLKRVASDFKGLGHAAFQVIYNEKKDRIVQVEHLPVETLRMEKMGESGEVEGYFYSRDWSKHKKNGYKPQRIPAFGHGEKGDKLEILYIKEYRSGQYYYSTVDYQGGLAYAELEEEIANYHINNIQNGFSPTMMITVPEAMSPEEQVMMKAAVTKELTGTGGSKFIMAFVNDKEQAPIVETFPLSDAPQQYQFLSEEAQQKILVSHRVTSPMLLGIKDNTGFGNNADELRTASILFHNTVIKPLQSSILEAIEEVLIFNGHSVEPYFKSSQPLEFEEEVTKEEKEDAQEEQEADMEMQEVDMSVETPVEAIESVSNELSLQSDSNIPNEVKEAEKGLFARLSKWADELMNNDKN